MEKRLILNEIYNWGLKSMNDVVFKTDVATFNYRVAGVWIINGHVLLHKSVNDEHWALPGGRVGIMEESKIGLQREFKEELDVEVQVENLIWTTENFFKYQGKDIHEIGFYYKVTSSSESIFNPEDFFGFEGERLIFKWVPIVELDGISLYPDFLIAGIKDIPKYPCHVVVI